MQTKPLAIYVGTACFIVAAIGGGTWAAFRSSKAEPPLFIQTGRIANHAPTANWPSTPVAQTDAGSIAYLNEWMQLVSPLQPRDNPVASEEPAAAPVTTVAAPASQEDYPAVSESSAKNAAIAPREIVKEIPKEESAKEKRAKKKAAGSEKRRRVIEREDQDSGEQDQTVGLGSTSSNRSAERGERDDEDRKSYRNRRDRDRGSRREREDSDRTIGARYRVERELPEPEIRVAPERPAAPDRGIGLFGIFDSFNNGW